MEDASGTQIQVDSIVFQCTRMTIVCASSNIQCVGPSDRGFRGPPLQMSNLEIVIRHVQGGCGINDRN